MKRMGRHWFNIYQRYHVKVKGCRLTFAYDNDCQTNKYPYMAQGTCI